MIAAMGVRSTGDKDVAVIPSLVDIEKLPQVWSVTRFECLVFANVVVDAPLPICACDILRAVCRRCCILRKTFVVNTAFRSGLT